MKNQSTTLISNNLTVQKILDLASMAKSASASEADIRTNYGNNYRIVVKDMPQSQGQCVLFFDDKQQIQYISNRGSSNLENFVKDGEYLKTMDNKTNIYMHHGFRDSAIETYGYILPELHKEYTTFITGHSLGGAIAVILHLYLLEDNFQIKQSVTFGQPQFTNQDGVNKYRNIPLLRVVHEKDLVPLLPPLTLVSSRSGSYRHLGEETILLDNSYYCHLDEISAENPNISDYWINLIKGETNINDHQIDGYISNLQYKLNGCNEIPYNQRENYLDKN
jgi:triacylglycerol lipase